MDDYEIQNARAWDDTIEDIPAEQPQFELITVESSRWKGKHPQRDRPQPPQVRPRVPPFSSLNQNYPPQSSQGHPAVRKWQHAPRQRGPPPPSRRTIAPRLVLEADSEAQRSWRKRNAPSGSVKIPAFMVHGDRYVNDIPTYAQIANEHGTYMYTEDLLTGNAFFTFGIWGELQDTRATQIAIENWISVAAPDSKKAAPAKFPKIQKLTAKLRLRMERRWEKDIERNRYRRLPPNDMAFGAIGSFHWPAEEYQPEECFGMSYEVLDPIRMDCQCYITFTSEKSLFQVFGKASHVQEALLRIRRACFQLAARLISPVRAPLLCWGKTESISTHVFLEEYRNPVVIDPPSEDAIELSYSPRGDGLQENVSLIQKALCQSELSIERIKATFADVLQKLHYYRGHMTLRVRLGTFLVMAYKCPKDGLYYELQEYEEMVSQSQFRGRVTEEMGDKKLEQGLLTTMQGAGDLFCPQDAITEYLRDITPVYSAVFIFEDENKGYLRLSMAWQHPGQSEFSEPIKVEWARLDRNTQKPTLLVDMSLTDLNTGFAWQFELSAAHAEDASKLPEKFRGFPNRVKIDKQAALRGSSSQSFVISNPYAKPTAMRQSLQYRYTITGTDYTLELARFQDREYTYPHQFQNAKIKTYEPRWSLNVYRVEWETWFGKNANLPVGKGAEWEHDVEEWFPADSGVAGEKSGLAQLIERLAKVEELVKKEGNDEE